MTLEEVAEELYGLPPREFTAARDAHARRARAAGDADLARSIRALRRPTLSAWAGNLLVRRAPRSVRELLRIGAELRRAHRELDGERLRGLGREGSETAAALTRTAARLAAEAGQEVGEAAQRELTGTLRAVLADPERAREWQSGRLARPLDAATGFDAAAGPLGDRTPARPAHPEGRAAGGARVRDPAVERERRRGAARSGAREQRKPKGGRGTTGSRGGAAPHAVGGAAAGGAGAPGVREAGRGASGADRRAHHEAEAAGRRAEEADRELARARHASRSAAEREEGARAEVDERVAALREARQARDGARAEARRARERVRAAERTAREARDAVQRAERAVGGGTAPG